MPKTFADFLIARCTREEAEAYHDALDAESEVVAKAICEAIDGRPFSAMSDGATLRALADASAMALSLVDDPNGVRLSFFLLTLVDALAEYRAQDEEGC